MIVLNQLDIVNDRLKSMLCLMSGCAVDASGAFTCFLFISYQPTCSLHLVPHLWGLVHQGYFYGQNVVTSTSLVPAKAEKCSIYKYLR